MPVEETANYIRIRQIDPDKFDKDSFRTINISTSKSIKAVVGKLSGESTTTIQTYLFDKEKWTTETAKAWISNHKKNKDYLDGTYVVHQRRVTQEIAGYSPYGADDSGCANCNWWVAPDSCVIVSDDVSPTGKCSFHFVRPPYEEKPVPVTIVESADTADSKSFIEKLAVKVKDLLNREKPPSESFMLFKSVDDDSWRFFCLYSNNFKDREGETFTLKSHKEYVNWVDETKQYPQLWLWHGGKAWGEGDWIDESDGFVAVSGKVYPEYNDLAECLSKEKLGTSHGFVGLISKDKTITKYRTFEVSPLPIWAAANLWTSFNLMEVKEMPFTDAKKQWLKEVAKVPEDQIEDMEKRTEALSKSLKELGIEWKGIDVDGVAELGTAIEAVAGVANTVKGLLDEVKASQAELKGIKDSLAQTIDTKVAEMISSKPKDENHTPSQDESNVQSKGIDEPNWFVTNVVGGL